VKTALTDLAIKSLGQGEWFDTRTPAFGIRVGKHRRTWFVMKGQDRRKVSLGQYPSLSLQDARKKALVALGSPEAKKVAISFTEAKEAFLGQSRWRPSSKRVIESSLRHFSWTRPLQKITYEDIEAALSAIPGRSARAHALKDIRTFFNWCVPRYLPSSPCVGLKMEPQPSRDRVLTDEELKAVWIAAEQCGQFGVIVKLLILTGQRRSEIGGLKWEWIKDDRITLPASVTKNGREHTFPITASVVKLLTSLTKLNSPLVFAVPGATKTSPPSWTTFSAWSKSHAALLKLSGTSGWTLHDLRRTFATGLAALGTPIHVTEKILNHVSGTTGGLVGIYQKHSYWPEQVEALRKWEERVLSLAQPAG
jgi:integrase